MRGVRGHGRRRRRRRVAAAGCRAGPRQIRPARLGAARARASPPGGGVGAGRPRRCGRGREAHPASFGDAASAAGDSAAPCARPERGGVTATCVPAPGDAWRGACGPASARRRHRRGGRAWSRRAGRGHEGGGHPRGRSEAGGGGLCRCLRPRLARWRHARARGREPRAQPLKVRRLCSLSPARARSLLGKAGKALCRGR